MRPPSVVEERNTVSTSNTSCNSVTISYNDRVQRMHNRCSIVSLYLYLPIHLCSYHFDLITHISNTEGFHAGPGAPLKFKGDGDDIITELA